jgi:hypothetical protein
VRAQRRRDDASLEERIYGAYRAYFDLAVDDRELFAVFRRNASVIAMMPDEGLFEAGIEELFEDLLEWARAGELPDGVDLDYLATAMVGTGFQVATHLVDRDPPDPDAAARFCARLLLGGIEALAEERALAQ